MKKIVFVVVLSTVVATAAPGYAFLDYLFGGAQTSDAIGNSVVGDLRAWWTGNPVYQFNPYYSGSPNPVQQSGGMQGRAGNMQGSFSRYGAPQGSYQPQQQPSVTYFPPQTQQGGYAAYGQGQPTYGSPGVLQQYQQQPQYQYQQQPQYQYQQQPQYQYQQQPQYQYQQAAPYQQAPQTYQQVPQYQGGPQAYQNPGMYGR